MRLAREFIVKSVGIAAHMEWIPFHLISLGGVSEQRSQLQYT